MAIVRAIRNPNSQASLYGNTSPGDWNAQEQDFFIQNPDGTYSDKQGNPVDFSKLLEQSYQNADGIQGGQPIYQDPSTFVRAENPAWWDEFVRSQAGGVDYADSNIYSNPQLNQLNTDVQQQWQDKYRPNRNSGNLLTDLVKIFGPAIALGTGLGVGLPALFGGGAAAGAGGGYAAADALGLSQMGQAAGLSGNALADFVASGGTLGSTAAGGGGIGFGALDGTQFADLGGTATDATTEAALPNIDPNAVMGVDYGTGGEGTGLLQGAATGAGGPTMAQILKLAAASGNPLGYLTQVLNGGGDSPVSSGGLGVPNLGSLLGTLGATAAGAYTANQQTNDLKDLANKYMEFGAPSRARYEGSFAPGFTMASDPGYQDALDSTSSSLLRKLSAAGNPFDNPGGLIEANKQINSSLALPALQNYRNQNAATGGYGAFNTAAPGAATAAIGSQGNALTTIAGGASDILNPKPPSLTLADLMKQFGGGQNNNGTIYIA